MFTYPCDFPLEFNAHLREIYDEETYFDITWTMECPVIQLTDIDSDGFREVHVTQDSLCKEFAHPWENDPKELVFKINEDGKFVEMVRR